MTDHPTGDAPEEREVPTETTPTETVPEGPAPAAAPPRVEPWEEDWDDETPAEDVEADASDAPVDEGGDQPPVWETETLPPLPPRRGAGGAVAGLMLVVLSLGLLACAAWAVKLHRDQQLMAGSFDQTLAMIAEVAPPALGDRLAALRGDLQAGQLSSLSDKLTALRGQVKEAMAGGEGGAGTGPIPESAYKDLPPDAARFFKQHEDLFRRFLMMCTRAREMRDAGQNVDRLRKARDEVIESARLGQLEQVQQGMLAMARLFGGRAGGNGQRGKLAAKLERFKQAAERAAQNGRDPRPAIKLVRQAEAAAEKGDLATAGKLMDQALAAVHKSPRRPTGDAGPRGWFGRGRAQRANPLAGLMRVLLGVMQLEERDLGVVWDQLGRMQARLKGPEPGRQPDVLLPILDTAVHELKTVADRRRELTTRLGNRPGKKSAAGKTGSQRPGLGEFAGLRDARRQAMLVIIGNRLDALLDRVRGLSDEEYRSRKLGLMRDVVQSVLRPPSPEEQMVLGIELPQDPAGRTLAERLRAKMLKASPVLEQQQIAKQDTTKVEALFAEAAKLIQAGKLAAAEPLVDQALGLLGIPLDQFSAPPAAGGEKGPVLDEGTPESGGLHLNMGPRRQRMRYAAPETPDNPPAPAPAPKDEPAQ